MTVKGHVAAGILPAVEPGFLARRKPFTHNQASRRFRELLKVRALFSGGKDARPLRQPKMVAATIIGHCSTIFVVKK